MHAVLLSFERTGRATHTGLPRPVRFFIGCVAKCVLQIGTAV